MNRRDTDEIRCPFFSHIYRNMIACEGFIEGTCMTTSFPSAAAAKEHTGAYCEKEDGGKCPLALSLYDKYEKLETLGREYDRRKEIYNRG